ncbi:MAG: GxxExxY protein [Candidatus Cloacimonetes bacterium]|nr:GxxExxY protein [Candidatus Cloacimonadota bacterium]
MTDADFDNELTGKIINCFYRVYNELGFGYLEKVYEKALKLELDQVGLKVELQKPIQVLYKGVVVGDYFADMLVENQVIVEIKSVTKLGSEHEAQLINYLATTNTQVGLLLNFGPDPKVMRKIHTIKKTH